MRIVSLLPSATETVCALGRRADLVGRSQECDYPGEVRSLPVVMRARTLDAGAAPREIDRRVQAARGGGESLYELDLGRLADLSPDLILTQELCGVCSVTEHEVVSACRQAGVDPKILSLSPRRLSEVWEGMGSIADAIHAPAEAKELLSWAARLSVTEEDAPTPRPRIAVVEWLDPPIVVGLWGPDQIRSAGGAPVAGEAGLPGMRTSWTDLARLAPDLVVIAPCSFTVERTRSELERLPEIAAAVGRLTPSRGVWLADEAYFSRPGPRLAHGVQLLRTLMDGRVPEGPMPVEVWTRGADR